MQRRFIHKSVPNLVKILSLEYRTRSLSTPHLGEHAVGDGELAADALGFRKVELEHAEALRVDVDAQRDIEAS